MFAPYTAPVFNATCDGGPDGTNVNGRYATRRSQEEGHGMVTDGIDPDDYLAAKSNVTLEGYVPDTLPPFISSSQLTASRRWVVESVAFWGVVFAHRDRRLLADLRLYTPPEKACVDLAVAAFATSSEIIPVLYHVKGLVADGSSPVLTTASPNTIRMSLTPVSERDLYVDPEDKHADIVSVDKHVDQHEERNLFTYQQGKQLLRRADWHILPILILLYLSKNMDGNLVSYVKTINTTSESNILAALNITSNQYAYAATCFSVTFVLFEVPSNFLIKWSTPRLHFFRIVVAWSIITACTAAVSNLAGFLTARAFLGMAEAGLYPGMLWQLTFWYRPDEIAVRMTALGVLGQFSGILDSLLTYGISYIDGRGGLDGWRWAFLIVGLIGLFESVLVWFWYPDFPDSPPSRRQFLTPEEGAFLVARLPPNSARSSDSNFDWAAVRRELKSPLLWGFSFSQMCTNSALYGLSFWLPTIITSFGLTQGPKSQLLVIPSAVVYIVTAILLAWFLDNDTRVPRPLLAFTGCFALIGIYVGMIVCKSKPGLYVLIIFAQAAGALIFAPLLPLRAQSLRGSSSAAFAFAFQNSCGQIPGLYTAQFFQSKYAPRYAVPFGICIAFTGAVFIANAWIWYWQYDLEKETRRVARARRAAGKSEGVVVVEEVKSI
ncbi:uncharacterized protein EHS24_005633 [Apiotrichum porosum]|uniref:Major facilitator superfamily (MFS) profile domain-containing protein n=1 Tax=Apiotrichum porosum TaxID=105984 RepID=A0A427XZ62_9TREE|nr:uncharacterized protein EHS24_005633 [Apiotrichum porosum]RSH84130.1 hypothetical protein EHS24_005633 [Apiotrichum porosum]